MQIDPALPTFLVIGAARSGTTSLHHYLRQHPQIFMPELKEPNYFAYQGQRPGFANRRLWPITSFDDYRRLFAGVTRERAIGEISPAYLSSAIARRRIHETLPDVRIVALLRHPVDRAFSSHIMHIDQGLEKRAFAEVVRDELASAEGQQPRPCVVGRYHDRLAPWFARFGTERVRVFLYDDLVARPRWLLRELFTFIGVDTTFSPDLSTHHNRSGRPKSRLLQYALRPRGWTSELRSRLPVPLGESWNGFARRVKNLNLAMPPPREIEDETRLALDRYYEDDIDQLERSIQRDLSHWKRSSPIVWQDAPPDSRSR